MKVLVKKVDETGVVEFVEVPLKYLAKRRKLDDIIILLDGDVEWLS